MRLRQVLEPAVHEKYYVPEDKAVRLFNRLDKCKSSEDIVVIGQVNGLKGYEASRRLYATTGSAPTVTTGISGNSTTKIVTEAKIERIGSVTPSGKGVCGQVYMDTGLSPTLNTNESGGVRVLTHACEIIPVLTPDRVAKRQNGRRCKENDDEAFTLTAQDRHGIAIGEYPHYRIRKLTPLECWRLQGFTDEQFHKAKEAKVSNTQLYKQAGNAVTVNVIQAIAGKMISLLQSATENSTEVDETSSRQVWEDEGKAYA